MADLRLGELIDSATHKRNGTAVSIPTGDYTTHGVIVGMTGSGKTGLGMVLVEEVLRAGVPVILIDPKGDLANLCLTFPNLSPADFKPWVNEGDAQKAGKSVDDFAAEQAKTWSDGLASWGLSGADIGGLRDKTRITIYTPGSASGIGMNIVGSLQAPKDMSDMEVVHDEIGGFVSGLLGLVGIEADPLSSREHILLSNLIEQSWSKGTDMDLATLVGQVMTPPIRKLGVFDLDTFFPPADRQGFAMKLNGLLASSAFAAWSNGEPLDIDSLLRSPDGKPCAAIVSIAHLSDEERQFVVSLLLSKLVTWMRRQSGTTDLRALLYMDEVAGYLPPTAMPPTKKPIMTLMKQARAFGVGVVLSTQNPVDIDYKAISNAGTWMVGHLQTERDKSRLLEGMSAADGGVDIGAVGDTISGLGKREFVLRRAGKDKPEVMTSRWAMSYLRGPLTRDQIAELMTDQKGAAPSAAGGGAATASPVIAASSASADETPVMPEIASGTPVRFVVPSASWLGAFTGSPSGNRFEAAAVARVRMRYDDEKAGITEDQEWEAILFPLSAQPDPSQCTQVDYDDRDLVNDPPAGASYVLPEASLKDRRFWSDLERGFVDHLVRNQTVEVFANKTLKLYSRVGETEEQFAARCKEAAAAGADGEAAKLRDKYEAKAKTIQDQLQIAQGRLEAAKSQEHSTVASNILSTAGSILGSFLGGRRNAGSIAGKVISGIGRSGRGSTAGKRADVVETKVEQLTANLQSVEDELTTEVSDISARWDGVAAQVDTLNITLEKTDVQVAQLALVWIPVA